MGKLLDYLSDRFTAGQIMAMYVLVCAVIVSVLFSVLYYFDHLDTAIHFGVGFAGALVIVILRNLR